MKRFFSQFRIFLLTLAFGLACVPFVNDVYKRWIVFSINVPQVKSETPLFVFPMKPNGELPYGGGGSSGGSCEAGGGCGSGGIREDNGSRLSIKGYIGYGQEQIEARKLKKKARRN
jgi:hypothetical protein